MSDLVAPELAARMRARVGTHVRSKFTLDALLGLGATGAVFAVTHRNGSRVALKVLYPELAAIPELRARFLSEGYIANRIRHEGVVKIIEDDDDDELATVFLVMELLEGQTLANQARANAGRIALDEVLVRAIETLDVLAAAHAEGIIHRDVKPDNLFVTTTGKLKVLDFGIARLTGGTSTTRSGQRLGTPAFMAPEQAGGRIRDIDARTDIWALGASMFALLTGRHVHIASTPSELTIYAATQSATPIASVADVPVEVARVIDRALAFERSTRFSSAREMRDALRALRA
jgi:serine/threonine-protein kinase